MHDSEYSGPKAIAIDEAVDEYLALSREDQRRLGRFSHTKHKAAAVVSALQEACAAGTVSVGETPGEQRLRLAGDRSIEARRRLSERRIAERSVPGRGGEGVPPGRSARPAPTLGLSTLHISPQRGFGGGGSKWWRELEGAVEDELREVEQSERRRLRAVLADEAKRAESDRREEGRIEWFEGGNLVRIRPSNRSRRTPDAGGERGDIRGFSDASRRRLLQVLAMLNRERCGLPVFVTLTYPGEWPSDPQQWKRHLDAWLKRLRRRHGDAWAVWKLEPQRRGAPHFHLLVFGLGGVGVDKTWLSRSWYEVVGSGDERHLRAGTRVESVRSWRGVMSYAAKYLGKVESLPDEWRSGVGRWWGVHNRAVMRGTIKRRRVTVSRRALFGVYRIICRYVRSKGYQRKPRDGKPAWLFVPAGIVERAVELKTQRERAPGAAVDFVGDGVAPF